MKSLFSRFNPRRIKNYAINHKVISAIALVVFLIILYWTYGKLTDTSGETRYVISAVERGTVITTVSGSGQVSALRQLELKPKASGDIVYLGAKSGQYVGAGQLILQVDARDAKIALENAKLNLQKAVEANTLTTGGLAKNSEDSLTNINKTFLDLPAVFEGLDSMLNNYTVSIYKINLPNDKARAYYDQAEHDYYQVLKVYEKTLADYQKLSRPASDASVLALTQGTYLMLQSLSQTVKDTSTYINFVYDYYEGSSRSPEITADRNSVDTWLPIVNADLTAISLNLNTMRNSSLDIKAQKLTVQQQENNYADYFLYAPFSGLVQINVNQGDSASNGTTIGAIVSAQKIATVSLNEVDIAKVKVGQKATITFDAIDELSMAGEVTEVDIVGTVSQGVVNYNVKIAFDTQDERIKSGMSASASIAVGVKKDVLKIASSAIKRQGGNRYVEVFDQTIAVTGNKSVISATLPTRKKVEVGISDDFNTEIISGLDEGDKVVTKTILPSTQTTTSQAPSIFGGSKTGSSGTKATSGGFSR